MDLWLSNCVGARTDNPTTHANAPNIEREIYKISAAGSPVIMAHSLS
jgi:hypothetical protein